MDDFDLCFQNGKTSEGYHMILINFWSIAAEEKCLPNSNEKLSISEESNDDSEITKGQ